LHYSLLNGNVHASTDLWSSRTLQPITGVRLHYFNDQFELRNRRVAYRHFGETHTATNTAPAFEGILSEFSIESQQLGYIITDNAANMLEAFKLFSDKVASLQSSIELYYSFYFAIRIVGANIRIVFEYSVPST
jgi:hypothetical protein